MPWGETVTGFRSELALPVAIHLPPYWTLWPPVLRGVLYSDASSVLDLKRAEASLFSGELCLAAHFSGYRVLRIYRAPGVECVE